jgi:hypothetical protein
MAAGVFTFAFVRPIAKLVTSLSARRWRERILGKRGGSLNGVSSESDMMAVGKPSADVKSFRGKVPDEVFGEPFVPPVSDGSGQDVGCCATSTHHCT